MNTMSPDYTEAQSGAIPEAAACDERADGPAASTDPGSHDPGAEPRGQAPHHSPPGLGQ